MIAIVTESLSCMNLTDCAAYGVSLAPLDCVVGDRVLHDHIITAEPPLSEGDGYSVAPTEEEYRTRFEVLLRDFDGILCITASRKFSDSNRHALLASAAFAGRVVVIDSGSVAGGLFLMVSRARHLVTMNYPMSRIKAELEAYKNTLRVSFTTDSVKVLENARKLSYKMPVGKPILSQHPLFRIEGGGIGVYDFASGDRQTADGLLTVLTEPRTPARKSPSHVVVHYANRSETVLYIISRLHELFPSATVYERPITLSIQLNLGYGIIGLIGD